MVAERTKVGCALIEEGLGVRDGLVVHDRRDFDQLVR